MPKALFNIAYTTASPPSKLTGSERANYIARRKFYNLTSSYNFFSYALSGKKVIKNANAEQYFTRGGTNGGLFNFDGVMNETQIKELKAHLKETKSIIWHGFVSFDETLTETFNVQENAIKFMRQTFGAFIERTPLKKDNLVFYASLHGDTDNRHIHFAFCEKEPKRRDKNGNLCFTKKGKFDAYAIDNYLVSANMHLDEHGDEYYRTRDEAIKQLNSVRNTVVSGVGYDIRLVAEIRALIKKLPEKGRLQYGAGNMVSLRPSIDYVAQLLIKSNPAAMRAHENALRKLAEIKASVEDIVKNKQLVYVDNRKLTEKQMRDAMTEKSKLQPNSVDFQKVDHFERLSEDYKRRIGNVVLGLCKEIKRGDFRDSKHRYAVNDKHCKIEAKHRRKLRGRVIQNVRKLLCELSIGAQANFVKTVQQNEREIENNKVVNY